jgi:hypothetical protein
VAQKEVFYFNEFRDLTKATDARKTSWNDLVRVQAIVNIDEATCTEKQRRYKRTRDTQIHVDDIRSRRGVDALTPRCALTIHHTSF